jgi:hypothetical protein
MALMSNDFFSRWSKRKLDEAAAPPEAAPQEAEAAPPSASLNLEAKPPQPPEMQEPDAAIAPEELAALPDPDELTAGSDITGFLRQGVPLALRNRALRRMWSLDPAIRDYIGDARDYAWDWNTPGGMPVSGPLSATTDVQKILRGLYEPAEPTPIRDDERIATREAVVEPAPDRGVGEKVAAPPQPDAVEPAKPADGGDAVPPARLTRHGGALPS